MKSLQGTSLIEKRLDYMEINMTLAEILTLLGGQSAILLALVAWLGNVWAQRISNNDQAKANSDLAALKSEVDRKLAALNAGNESKIHVSKIQYEREFSSYAEIWDLVYPIPHKLQILFSNKQSYEFFKKEFFEIGTAKIGFSSKVNSLYPFIDEVAYKTASECADLLQKYWYRLNEHLNYLEKKASGEVKPSAKIEEAIGELLDEATAELQNASANLARCIRARNEEMVVLANVM